MDYRSVVVWVQNVLRLRGSSLVARALADIDTKVAQLEAGVAHIAEDLAQHEQNRAEQRAAHLAALSLSYDKTEALERASDRAVRVANRFKGLVS